MLWEEAGHYYTIYFVGLACGLPEPLAHRLAFWAQLPDEVSELDAVKAGFQVPESSLGVIQHSLTDDIVYKLDSWYAGLNNEIVRTVGLGSYGMMAPPAREPYQNLTVNLNVQKGLHCLTGRDWDIETRVREGNSRNADIGRDAFDFGISLHSLGDSFAHRMHDQHRMYPPFLGHGPVTKVAEYGGELARLCNFYHPDSLSTHRRKEYYEYVVLLHSIVHARYSEYNPQKNARETADILGRIIVDDPTPTAQIDQIRRFAREDLKGVSMNEYQPERWEDVELLNFTPGGSPVVTTWYHIQRALELAAAWSPR